MLHFGLLGLAGFGDSQGEKPGEFQHGASPEFTLVLQRNDPQWSSLAWKHVETRHLWGHLWAPKNDRQRMEEIGQVFAKKSMRLYATIQSAAMQLFGLKTLTILSPFKSE